jgi:hypothetical protein
VNAKNAISNQIGIEEISNLLRVKERRAKDRLKEWGIKIYPEDPYAKNKFVLLEDFLPAYNKYKFKNGTPNVPVEGKLQSLNKTENEMETPTLRQSVKNLFLICKHKIPYKDNSSVTCDCKVFRYQAHIYHKGVKNPSKLTLQASNLKDAKTELDLLKAEFLVNGGRKDLLQRQPIEKPAHVATTLPVMPQLGQIITPELLMQLLGQLQPQQPVQHQSQESLLLMDCYKRYLDYLDRENNTKANNGEAKKFLDMMLFVFKEAGYPVAQMQYTHINLVLAQKVETFFKTDCYWINSKGEKTHKVAYKAKTFDKAIGRCFYFCKKIIKDCCLQIPNYFDKDWIKRSSRSHKKPIMFPIEEFAPLLSVITYKNGWKVSSDGKNRNWYKPWLQDAIIAGVFMAGRRESVATIRWSDIVWEKKIPVMLEYENLKVNRKEKITEQQHKKYDNEVITGEFEKYLIQKGMYDKINSDEYIVAPEEKSRQKVMKVCTVGFPHFYGQLKTGKRYLFKHLRKTNFTLKQLEANLKGEEMKKVHANKKTTINHYIDPVQLAYHTKNNTKVQLLNQ